jgi:hypothetical protein
MNFRANRAGRVALTAVLGALSLIFLYLASVLPTGRLGLVAVAGLFPAAAVVSSGLAAGALCYAGTGLLGLLLVADKGAALLYLLFFGLYPLVKYEIERLKKLPLELVCKLAFFNLVLLLFWFLLRNVLLTGLPTFLQGFGLVLAAGNGAFLCYDYGFSKLIGFYILRIDRAVRR